MEMSYLLYSTKLQGWMTRTGVYDSDHNVAARYNKTEAFALVRRHMDQERLVLLPILAADLMELAQ